MHLQKEWSNSLYFQGILIVSLNQIKTKQNRRTMMLHIRKCSFPVMEVPCDAQGCFVVLVAQLYAKLFCSIYQEYLTSLQPWEIKGMSFSPFPIMFVHVWFFFGFCTESLSYCFPLWLSEFTLPTAWVIYTAVNEEKKEYILKKQIYKYFCKCTKLPSVFKNS